MSNSTAQLIDQFWQHLQAYVPTTHLVDQYHEQWQQFSGQAAIRTVIFGAYDSGKSSLLKRLLVEAGSPVPDWVTISARRETFESREVVAGPIAFVDSPGLSSGNGEHDIISRKALQLADAYIWVMPPQLVTSGQADFVAFLNGSFSIRDYPLRLLPPPLSQSFRAWTRPELTQATTPTGLLPWSKRKRLNSSACWTKTASPARWQVSIAS